MTLVLVVDDVAPLAEQYAYDLRRTGGYEVLTAPAGEKAMEILARPGTSERRDMLGKRLADGLAAAAEAARVPSTVNRLGSMVTRFFTTGPVTDYASARTSDTARFGAFFRKAVALRPDYAPAKEAAVRASGGSKPVWMLYAALLAIVASAALFGLAMLRRRRA
jgi:glutamate-1-semialdehyde aminotransferase